MSAPRKKPTKSELRERELRAALSWPETETPVPLTTDACKALVEASPTGLVRAWTYNAGRRDVMLGCFDRYNHRDDGPLTKTIIPSQGLGGPWFLSREDACLALRATVTREVADALVTLDARIGSVMAAELPRDAPDAEPATSPSGP